MRILLVGGWHYDIVLLQLFRMINLFLISTTSAQIRVHSSNYFIYSIKSLIRIDKSRSSRLLHIDSILRHPRYTITKSHFLFLGFLIIITSRPSTIYHTLMLTSHTWTIVFTFFIYLIIDLLVAVVGFHLAYGCFTLFCFRTEVFAGERVFTKRCLV